MMISLENVTKVYPTSITKKVTAVQDLSLSVKEGEVYSLLGPNGSGKTTTLKLILGLVKPTSGKAILLGKNPTDYESRESVGYLPENPYFYSHLTGKELLHFAAELHGINPKKNVDKINDLIETVGMKDKENIPMKGYSKGMLQRIGMAQALINDPKLILLDEPMSGLDPIGRYEVKQIVLDLKKRGKTIFFCSHILSDVEEICTDFSIIVDGQMVSKGEINKIKKSKKSLEEHFIEIVKTMRK